MRRFSDYQHRGVPAPGVPVIGYNASGNELIAEGAGDGPFSWQWYLGDGTPIKEATFATFTDPMDGEEYYDRHQQLRLLGDQRVIAIHRLNVDDVDAIEWKLEHDNGLH